MLGLAIALPSSSVLAGPQSCGTRVNNTQEKLQECVTLEGVRAHQAAFQAAADFNDDTRAAGTPGYDETVDYVADTLEAAGYTVELNPFDFTFVPPPILIQTAPFTEEYETGAFTGTGFGQVSGPVVPVDLALGDLANSTSGCESSDFAGLDFSGPADIALVRRGT